MGCENEKVNEMEFDVRKTMTELGGAFAVTWLVFGITVWNNAADMTQGTYVVGLGIASVGGVLAMAIAWMAFKGADILPPVTWMKHMSNTDNLSDVDAWINTVITLVTQIVGAALAIFLMAEITADYVTYEIAHAGGQEEWAFDAMTVMSIVAAGAVLGHISSKVDSVWAMPVAVMAMAGIINFESAADMASMIMNETGDMMAVAVPWIVDGICVGAGALIGGMIDENLPGEEE
ncbi:MAG: hypothetical protein CMB65_00270 [Euryarchaeota archaeon]|nr:hypothetical protein [Euryarchaeota archaeon]|tara:strand:- start:47 stop:748 length:702 start_codon:yes stop_codon:yes gene_type:complete